ncbi:MAG: FprA family A-type flavoprotein [Candidatus Bathyarchaeia archaeon]|jgi:flavorubredoxin|nr:FprA family A-type flavoprotein [Candidatus Bathyarchaeota archaeon A05DMB-4]MDH7595092.1 FprA family A-type flavoprotein [Candidatus Bathyarchaeota archaeon]
MNWRNTIEISKGVYWVGVRDWNRRVFDALIPLPKGTTYNSYLVVGEEKKALIDTVNPGFEKELEERIGKTVNPNTIDYVVMNHAEPDHVGAIPYVMALSDKAQLLTTKTGAKMAQTYFKVPEERIIVVKDQDAIALGGKTLRFIEAPMLHWPETMFTYLQENKILFPCDFFGSHVADGFYDEDLEDLLVYAQKYYGEIMMPYSSMGQRAMEKIRGLQIEMVAPSHGPIYKNPSRILDSYKKWVAGETKRKATIVYVTMWNSTKKMIQPIMETLSSEGVEIVLHDLVSVDVSELAKGLVDSRAIVLGAPTVLGGAHPLAVYAAHLVKALRPPAMFGVVLSSYGWGGGAVKQLQEILASSKIEIVGALEINGPPTEENVGRIIELGRTLAQKIKEHDGNNE